MKGVGMAALWEQMAAMAAIGVVVLSVAIGRFSKTLG
jgi:hypothetical protein